jgi:hypothetical protein
MMMMMMMMPGVEAKRGPPLSGAASTPVHRMDSHVLLVLIGSCGVIRLPLSFPARGEPLLATASDARRTGNSGSEEGKCDWCLCARPDRATASERERERERERESRGCMCVSARVCGDV